MTEIEFTTPVQRTEMSVGLDLDWTGSGLWRILLIMGWIRTVKNFMNLGSGPDLDWVNGKEQRDFCHWKAVSC